MNEKSQIRDEEDERGKGVDGHDSFFRLTSFFFCGYWFGNDSQLLGKKPWLYVNEEREDLLCLLLLLSLMNFKSLL